MGWNVFCLPLDEAHLARLKWQSQSAAGPAFHRGTFNITTPGDTFLDLRGWRRGVVWVNGRCLSRFWHIGPQQTAYLPGAWLRSGTNDVLIFDVDAEQRAGVEGLPEPILNKIS